MEKRGYIAFIFLIALFLINSSFVLADTNSSVAERGYTCLENLIKNETTSSISLQEAIFSTLALGSRKVAMDKIDSEKNSQNCWPKSSCTVKETAQVALAYNRAGKGTDDILKWLYSNNVTSSDLNWYLEIDISNHGASECTLKYDNNERKITIGDDMLIKGNPGSCFSISQNGYWLGFRESCFDKDIQISCNQDFITALIYTKKSGGTVYVLPQVNSAAALGSTTEKVDVKCFKSGSKCDYEGSLWATLALLKIGKKIDAYLPYLVAMSDDNTKYFPSAFLYALTSADDQYTNIIQSQKQGRSWKMISSPYDEYYDTSLALLALGKASSSEADSSRTYLASIQNAQGCWDNNNLRNTAFILYGAWSRAATSSSSDPGTVNLQCTSVATQSCELYNTCIDAGGRSLSNFECSGLNICCSVKVALLTCADQKGNLCSDTQECLGTSTPSSDSGTCCLSDCQEKPAPVVETCSDYSGTCNSLCGENEVEVSEGVCTNNDYCCAPKPKGGISSWIIILILLIILVVLAIVFRDKLRLWWFKYKGRAKSTPVVKPDVPANNFSTRPNQQFRPNIGTGNYPLQSPARPVPVNRVNKPLPRKPTSDKDKEFEDTLKKLKDMSK